VAVIAADAKHLPFLIDFQSILADVPCSGTGTLARNPEIKWRIKPDDLKILQSRQVGILSSAMSQVAPGGTLVYSTCSLESEEGEGVIHRFLQGRSDFRLIRPDVDPSLVTDEGFVRTYPHIHGTAGFFAAVMERSG